MSTPEPRRSVWPIVAVLVLLPVLYVLSSGLAMLFMSADQFEWWYAPLKQIAGSTPFTANLLRWYLTLFWR